MEILELVRDTDSGKWDKGCLIRELTKWHLKIFDIIFGVSVDSGKGKFLDF